MKRLIYARTLRAVSALLAAGALFAAPDSTIAQDAASAWPTKPIRIIVPFGAGSFTEIAARTVGAELSDKLGQPIIVETKGGAGSTIGTDLVAKAPNDGYTF